MQQGGAALEGPRDNGGGVDPALRQADDNLAEFLHPPAAQERLVRIIYRGNRLEVGGQAAMVAGGCGSLAAWKRCPRPMPSVPLETAQRPGGSRAAPPRVQRICCYLFTRRFTRKLAVPSVSALPPRTPIRCRS